MDYHLAYSVLMPLAPWEPPEQVAMALESLEAQTLPPAQVVVSCDGAPPEALNHVLSSTCLPITLVLGPGCEGVGPVLARGLECCAEDLVVRADADDISYPHRCERQLAVLCQHPEFAVLGSAIIEFVSRPELPIAVRHVPLSPAQVRSHSYWRNPMNHPSVALRRSAVLLAGGYRDIPAFEDYELWLRLLSRGCALANIPDALVAARVGSAHLQRRRGFKYALKEWHFLQVCRRCQYFSWAQIMLMAFSRLPLRLLPASFLACVTGTLLRRDH